MTQVHHPLGTLASEFGVTRDVLRRIVAEAGVCSVGKRSGHPLYRLRDVYLAVIGQQQSEQLNPYARYALARAVKTEDEIIVRRGDLVEATDVERQMGLLFIQVARAFDTAVDNLESTIGVSPKQATRLEQHFDNCREQLYREVIDGKERRQETVRKSDSGSKRNHERANRGPKGKIRLCQTRMVQRRNEKKN